MYLSPYILMFCLAKLVLDFTVFGTTGMYSTNLICQIQSVYAGIGGPSP